MPWNKSRLRGLARGTLAALALVLASASAFAADKKAAAPALPEVPAALTAAEADAFLAKLTDAQARALLARELQAKAQKKVEGQAPAPDRSFGAWLMGVAEEMEDAPVDMSRHSGLLMRGMALLPSGLSSGATRIFGGRSGGGVALQLALLAAVLAAGALASSAVRRTLRPHGLEPQLGADAGAGARVSAGVLRFVLDLAPFLAFTVVAIGLVHAAFASGSAERSFHVAYVTGAIVVAGGAVLLRLVLSPRAAALRLLPLGDAGAAFLYRWLMAAWAVMVFAALTAEIFLRAGVPREAVLALTAIGGSLFALTLIAMVLASRPLVAAATRMPAALAHTWYLLLIAYIVSVWAFWARALVDGQASRIGAAIASLAIVLAFPLADYWIGRAIDDIVGQARDATDLRRYAAGRPLRWAMRVLLAVFLVTGVADLWGFYFFEWQVRLRQALFGASFDLIAAFVVAVLGWQFIRFAIDRRLEAHEVDGVRVEPSQRLRTLLPLARVFLVSALIATTVMLILSGLGVNIGPLLAGAGIVGLAIGFGAQTLVRDIITGVFLILDDAFRVGEYIQSGSYKGTVESIGLRSVKLRHHRGPIFVVPFGELRGVQNMVRDWVIHKITVGVTYDSDLEKARKLVKKIGQELAADPEYAADILQPLKMQGVEAFGEFAIQVRMKMTTRPGEKQFAIRRRAYAMIKKAFDENGIKFAFPTVQIAGGGGAAAPAVAAAATRVLKADDAA